MEEYLIFLLLFSAFTESYLSGKWASVYFTKGAMLPISRIDINEKQVENIEKSNKYSYQKDMQPTIIIKRISKDKFAVREKLFEFTMMSYTAILFCPYSAFLSFLATC